MESFLSLSKFKLHPTDRDTQTVFVQFHTEGEQWDEQMPLLKGSMRGRLSTESTQRLIQALQQGSKVVILVDGFEQTLASERFSELYVQFGGSAVLFQNSIKGLFDP